MRDSASKIFRNAFVLPNQGLRAYFDHVEQGQPDVYRTPFYKGKSVTELLDMWYQTLESIASTYPSLLEFEKDLGKKVGPMSVMKPLKERMSDIDSYYDSILLESKPISQEAISRAIKEWAHIAGMEIRSQNKTVDTMKKSTNSGSPYFTRRKRVVDKTMPCVLYTLQPHDTTRWMQELNYTHNEDEFDAVAILGWRGQEGGPSPEDVKQRVVWMFPFAVNICELQLYQPLIEAMQSGVHPAVPAWKSMDAVDFEITRMFDTKGKDDLVICSDFSKFDQHFNSDMQACAKQCIEALFTKTPHLKGWLDSVFPVKYSIGLAYDWDAVRTGPHGMASGSGGTNADETLAHRCLQHECALLAGKTLNPHSQCLGDDGVLTYPGITVDDVVQAYSSHGQEMNTDKQYASKHDCVYLRRWHHTNYRVNGICVGVYATTRALGRLCMQERWYDPEVWGPKMVALRQLSILENIKWHPLKEEFVDFCMKGDKYRLGIDIPGFFDNLEAIAQEATDYMPDFLGYTKSLQNDGNGSPSRGISDWWIVNYLKSKR